MMPAKTEAGPREVSPRQPDSAGDKPPPSGAQGLVLRPPWRDLWLVALLPALDAVVRLGRLHPDEVFQTLEPALWRAFGFGTLAWEWQVGLRNWAVPGLFALLLKAAAAVGLTDALARRALLEVPQYALNAAMLAAVWRLSARRVGAAAARLSVWLVGCFPLLVWFGGRTLGESFSAALLVWGLERLDADEPGPRAALQGGLLLGAAEITRYGSAAVIAPALLVLLAQRRLRVFSWAVVGGLAAALALGLLDRLTWGALPSARFGGWWHSLFEYVDFNLVSGRAAQQFGAEPATFYLTRFYLAPWAAVGLGLWLVRKEARAWLPALAALGYVAALTLTPHKEARFLYPALLLLTVAGTPAFAQWALSLREGGPLALRALAAAAVLGAAVAWLVPTPFDVERPEQFQLTVRAGREAQGFILMNEGLWGSGGAFYLGRDIPWCRCDTPQEACFALAARDPRFDRAVYYEDANSPARNAQSLAAFEAVGFQKLEQRGHAWYLARLPR